MRRSSIDFEIVIVEDSSPDGTYEVALQLQRVVGPERFIILKREGKLGLGSAYMDGLKKATGEFIFLMDADLSHHVRGARCSAARVAAACALKQLDSARRAAQVHTGLHPQAEGGRLRRRVRHALRARRLGAAPPRRPALARSVGRLLTPCRSPPQVHGWDLRRKLTSRVANYLAAVLLQPRASDLTGSFRCGALARDVVVGGCNWRGAPSRRFELTRRQRSRFAACPPAAPARPRCSALDPPLGLLCAAHLAVDPTDMRAPRRLYKREALARIMPRMQSRGYVFQMEVIVRAQQLSCSVGEVRSPAPPLVARPSA